MAQYEKMHFLILTIMMVEYRELRKPRKLRAVEISRRLTLKWQTLEFVTL